MDTTATLEVKFNLANIQIKLCNRINVARPLRLNRTSKNTYKNYPMELSLGQHGLYMMYSVLG
jgi:hypothetical protein